MRFFAATVSMFLLCTGVAFAAWSSPQTLPVSHASAIAVNGRGEVGVATALNTGEYRTALRLTVRTAGARVLTRRVWSCGHCTTGEVAVAVDNKGQVTIAWIVNTRRNLGGRTGPGHLYTAYGSLTGRMRHRQVLGRGINGPHLAVSGHGRVLLVWVGGSAESRHFVAAWRARGHRFRDRTTLTKPAVAFGYGSSELIPAFDTRGAAYVAGNCDATVRRTRPGGRRFRTILDAGRGLAANLSLAAGGEGVASWVRGSCTFDAAAGSTPGNVFASLLNNGRFGAEIALPSSDLSIFTRAVAADGGGGTVSWSDYALARTTVIAANGTIAAPQISPLRIVPFTRDGGGDQVLLGHGSSGPSVQFGVLVKRVEGGPLEQAPVSFGSLAVAAPVGRRVALAWNTNTTGGDGPVAVSVWSP